MIVDPPLDPGHDVGEFLDEEDEDQPADLVVVVRYRNVCHAPQEDGDHAESREYLRVDLDDLVVGQLGEIRYADLGGAHLHAHGGVERQHEDQPDQTAPAEQPQGDDARPPRRVSGGGLWSRPVLKLDPRGRWVDLVAGPVPAGRSVSYRFRF